MTRKRIREFLVSRRSFLGSSLALIGNLTFRRPLGALSILSQPLEPTEPIDYKWPQFLIHREEDELFLSLTAIGYKESRAHGQRYLRPVKNFTDSRLSFSLPPQHFAETAIGARQIPSHLPESVLTNLALVPSKESILVFRDGKRRTIHLTVAELLSWGNFELMLPDLNRVGSLYDLEIPRATLPLFTRIEMPWGIDLTPIAARRSITSNLKDRFVWDHNLIPTQDEWTELWSSALRNADDDNAPVSFELLSVRGFKRGATKGPALKKSRYRGWH